MIGATGSRHLGQRRRASLVSGSLGLGPSMLSHLEGVAEGDEGGGAGGGGRMGGGRPVTRRRVVDTSDLRTCAILQTRLKEIKTYPEMATFQADSLGRDDTDGGSESGGFGATSRKAALLSVPGMASHSTRSLFIFSEENFIRKYAKIIIEWGYPFSGFSFFLF
ncbi:voltage-dependent calcium channel type A subunit alpha-1-like, partial [Babylonia areolata]|uniref:voltage-dependent calcium channel type A subunit alpha-1-like n=1 Tax=Babylonia areolata TaxID=304850 RepID=UPI003FCF09BD